MFQMRSVWSQDWPSKQRQGGNNGKSLSTTSAAPAGHLIQKGNSSGAGGGQRQNRLYALRARQDKENSPDVVTATYDSLILMFMHF